MALSSCPAPLSYDRFWAMTEIPQAFAQIIPLNLAERQALAMLTLPFPSHIYLHFSRSLFGCFWNTWGKFASRSSPQACANSPSGEMSKYEGNPSPCQPGAAVQLPFAFPRSKSLSCCHVLECRQPQQQSPEQDVSSWAIWSFETLINEQSRGQQRWRRLTLSSKPGLRQHF